MTFTDTYLFKHISKSATRLDVVSSTMSNDAFEQPITNKKGEQFLYFCGDTHSKGKAKADYAITHGSYHMTGVFTIPGERYGYGNIKGTNDALIFDLRNLTIIDGKIEDGAEMIIYIARGMARDARQLCQLVNSGEFDGEFLTLQSRMTSKPINNNNTNSNK